MRFCIAIILMLFTFSAFAQEKPGDKKLVQFSGVITDTDSNTVIPYVTITNTTKKNQQVSANYQGYFSFVVNPGDTILFTAIGYNKFTAVIPKINPDNKYTVMVKMLPAVINLPTVRIFPWATVEEFTRHFLAMKIADDDLEIAKKNLSKAALKGMIQSLPRDGQEIQSTNYRYNFDRMMNKNMVQTNPLLNPVAWGKLMQQIFEGDKSRKEY